MNKGKVRPHRAPTKDVRHAVPGEGEPELTPLPTGRWCAPRSCYWPPREPPTRKSLRGLRSPLPRRRVSRRKRFYEEGSGGLGGQAQLRQTAPRCPEARMEVKALACELLSHLMGSALRRWSAAEVAREEIYRRPRGRRSRRTTVWRWLSEDRHPPLRPRLVDLTFRRIRTSPRKPRRVLDL